MSSSRVGARTLTLRPLCGRTPFLHHFVRFTFAARSIYFLSCEHKDPGGDDTKSKNCERDVKLLERVLINGGLILLAFFLLARLHAVVGANEALAQFPQRVTPDSGSLSSQADTSPDTTLWSEGRITAYREALGLTFDPPMAVLRIPRIGMEAPVLRGTDEASLNRGLGWIAGTAEPGAKGNTGVAGHRDGYFRVLKDVGAGDVIELETKDGVLEYVVESTTIIEPENVGVLAPTEGPALTLVTCYPFYYVGSAPQRFIVRAGLAVDSYTANGRARHD